MTALPTAPPGDDATSGWWDATRERRLTVQHCADCDGFQHPPRAVCIGCGRMDGLELRPAAGTGVVDSWTIVHRSPNPASEVPYVIARVRLAEGPILLTRLLADPPSTDDSWRIGDPVEASWWPLDDGRALPVFRRVER